MQPHPPEGVITFQCIITESNLAEKRGLSIGSVSLLDWTTGLPFNLNAHELSEYACVCNQQHSLPLQGGERQGVLEHPRFNHIALCKLTQTAS